MRPSNEIQLLKVSLPILIQEVWLIPGLQVCKSHWGFAQLTLPLELQCSRVQKRVVIIITKKIIIIIANTYIAIMCQALF